MWTAGAGGEETGIARIAEENLEPEVAAGDAGRAFGSRRTEVATQGLREPNLHVKTQ